MKKITLLLLLVISVLGVQAQTYQLNYDSIRVNKTAGTGGTSLYGKVYLKNVGIGVVGDSILTVLNGRIRKVPYTQITGLQDSLTKKANRNFDNVASGAIANIKLANSTISGVALGSNLNALTLGNGLTGTSYNGSANVTATADTAVVQTVSNFFPKGDTRYLRTTTAASTYLPLSGGTLTGTLNGTAANFNSQIIGSSATDGSVFTSSQFKAFSATNPGYGFHISGVYGASLYMTSTGVLNWNGNGFTMPGLFSLNNGNYTGGDGAFSLGADLGTFSRTNATAKIGVITTPHYTNSEEPFQPLYSYSASGTNEVAIGGGLSAYNAATDITYYTAANATTLTGTETLRIKRSGITSTVNLVTPSIKITTGAIAGNVLTSDGSGNATWQPIGSSYKGTWDASTNTPALADGVGTTGDYYVVSTGGTQFGRTFVANGQAIYSGTIWQPTGTATGVTSFASRTGVVSPQSADYSSFYPSLTGTGASGTWGIAISGNAATATSATTAGTVTTAAQTAITSVGTLTGLAVNGTISVINNTDGSVAGNPGIKIEGSTNPGYGFRVPGNYEASLYMTSVGSLNWNGTNITAPTFIGDLAGNASTVTTNANLTGVVTSTGNATAIADAALSIAKTSGLQSALDAKAPLASPALTGSPTAPTQTAGDNSTKIATTAYVDGSISSVASSNTYTPTPSAGSNSVTITPRVHMYTIVGKIVTVYGAAVIDYTSDNTTTIFSITLPAGVGGGGFPNIYSATGSGVSIHTSNVERTVLIDAISSTSSVTISSTSPVTVGKQYEVKYSFMYKIN